MRSLLLSARFHTHGVLHVLQTLFPAVFGVDGLAEAPPRRTVPGAVYLQRVPAVPSILVAPRAATPEFTPMWSLRGSVSQDPRKAPS